MAQAPAPLLAAHGTTVHVTSTELTRCHTPYSFPIQFMTLLQHSVWRLNKLFIRFTFKIHISFLINEKAYISAAIYVTSAQNLKKCRIPTTQELT